MSFREPQQRVDEWVSQFEAGSFPPLANVAGLGEVAAIVEAALIEVWTEFRKAGAQLVGIDAPGADLAEARRIDDVTDAGNGHQLCGSGGVLAGPPLFADHADTQLEPRLEGIEQTRLARARRARKHRVPAPQQVAQRGEPFIGLHRRSEQLIAGGLEAARQGLLDRAVELDVIDHHSRRYAPRLRHD